MLSWVRRLIVSVGIGGASFAIMLAIMILSILYDRELGQHRVASWIGWFLSRGLSKSWSKPICVVLPA